MKHSGKIKKAVMASVLAASMIVSIFNFGNVNGRNGPKVENKVIEDNVISNEINTYAASDNIPAPTTMLSIDDYFGLESNIREADSYSIGDSIPITMGFQMSDLMYGKWTTRTADSGFWIACNECNKMFDNNGDYSVSSGYQIDGCISASFNSGYDYGQPFTAWHWIPDDRACSATFHISLPEGLSYKAGTLKMFRMTKKEVASSAYHVDVSGQDITVTIDNIKDAAVHPNNLADTISITLDAELNSNASTINTVTASMSYDNGTGVKTLDLGNASIYSATMKFRNTGIDGNDLSGVEFALYKYKTMTSAGGVQSKKYIKILDGIQGNPSCTITGLSASKYKLVQTVAPAGYKKMSNYEFNINFSGHNSVIDLISVTDDSGTPILSPGANKQWSTDVNNAVIVSEIKHTTDETKIKEISAEIKYSYDGNIETAYTKTIKNTVSIIEENGEISTSGISDQYKAGYKFDCITVNGNKVDELPEFVHDGDLIIYHYVKDMDLKKTLRATVKYYKDNVLESSVTHSKEVGYFETMLPTDGISDKADEFSGYKLSKITVDGKEVQSIPAEVAGNTTICFYYVIDSSATKTLTTSVQHILVDWNTGAEKIQESDNFTYSKEVGILDSSYINANDIPVKGYNGFKTAYYYVGSSKKFLSEWSSVKILNGSTVKIYYTMDLSVSVTWSATVQYKLGDTVQDEITIQSEPANPYLFETGTVVLSTDRVQAKTYKGWRLSSITVNGQEKVSLPSTLQDGDMVVYNYVPVSSSVVVRYVDEYGESVADDIILSGTYGQAYETEQKTLEGYDFVSTNGNKEGTFGEKDITVTYQYAKKQMTLTVKYVDKDTGNEIADGYSSFVYYGETYETVAKDISGYEPAGDNGKTSGTYGPEPVEIIYYYTKAPVTLTVKHIFDGKEDLNKTDIFSKKPGEAYKTEPLDMLGYTCISSAGITSGIISEDITVTYCYEAVESSVKVWYVDEEGTPIDSPVTIKGKYGESYETVQREIEGYTFVSSTGNTNGTFGLSDIEVIYSYKESLASLVVRYVDEDGNAIAEQDEESYNFYSNYSVFPKEITGYDYKEVAGTSAPAKGTMTNATVTVIFVYQPKTVTITVKHVDESGKEIATKETITRKYKESYTTSSKEITGYVLTETPKNANGQTLAEDFKVTYVYAVDSSNTKTLSATVRYSLAGKLQDEDEEYIAKIVQILSTDTTLSTDSIHEKAYEGWVLDYITINDEERFNVLPETVDDKDVIIFVYKKAPASITVQYVDEDGREIKAPKTVTGKYGDVYQTTEEDIEGYNLISNSGNTVGEMKGNITVVYIYRLKNMSVTIKYVDEDRKEIAASKEISGKYGEAYTDSAIDILGYTIVSNRNVHGTFGDGQDEITYSYEKEKLSITVKYVDEKGNEIAEEEVFTKKYKEEYVASAKEIIGYKLVEIPENAAGQTPADDFTVEYVYAIDETQTKTLSATVQYSLGGNVQGADTVTLKETVQILSKDNTVSTDEASAKEYRGWKLDYITVDGSKTDKVPATVENGSTIVYHYRKTETAVTKVNITVKYVDEDGREIADTETIDAVSGSSYETHAGTFLGYDFVSDSGNTAGIADSDMTINYVYRLQDAMVTIKYVDEDGKEIAASDIISGKYGDKYETKAKEIAGYDFVSAGNNVKGIMKGNITITYIYKLQSAVVTIKYVDDKTNKEIAARETLKGNMFDAYDTVAKDINGYTLVRTPANAKGVITEKHTIVTYRYSANEETTKEEESLVIVQYVNEDGNKIASSVIIYGYVGDTYETAAKEIDGYELLASDDNVSGIMDKFTTIVTYVYKPASKDEPEHEKPAEGGMITVTDCPADLLSLQVYNYNPFPVEFNGKTYQTGALIAVISVNPNGTVSLSGLPYGTYRVKEYRTTTGFSTNRNYYTIKVEDSNGNVDDNINPAPAQTGSIRLIGADNISLHGMEFKLRNIGASSIVYNGKIINIGDDVGSFTTDSVLLMIDSLPYGIYELVQTGCIKGYHPDPSIYTINIVNDSPVKITIQVSNHEHEWNEGYITTAPTCTETGAYTYICTVCDGQMTEVINKLGHECYIKEPTCQEDGYRECTRCGERMDIPKVEHNWDDGILTTSGTSCETNAIKVHTCRYCGEQKTVVLPSVSSHSYETSIEKATPKQDGHIVKVCTKCGKEQEDSIIAGLSHIELGYSHTVYTGSVLKPSVTVYDTNGFKISSSYYNIAYSNNVKVGTASVKVTFKGNYAGVITKTFEITPHGTSILSVTPLSRGFTVKWAIQSREITGYELEYATKEDFSDAQKLQIAKYTTLAKSVTGLKADIKYYVRIRTYIGSSYSEWSAVKTVVTKK